MEWREVVEDRPYGETWVCGEPNLGCGVYEAGHGWYANIVIFNESYNLQPKSTKEEAISNAESCFKRLYEQYHEVVN